MKICVLGRTRRRGRYDPQPFPQVFHLGQRRLPVVAVLETWAEPPHRYFSVRVQDGRRFVLRHDPVTGEWELAAAYSGGRVPAALVRL
jgi:hypothetical protein